MQLFDYLPQLLYGGSAEVKTIEDALEDVLAILRSDVQSGQAQLFVNTASAGGLALWEGMLGLPVAAEKNVNYRRSRILSKLRGAGTTTVELIENVASSFANGEVEVTEHNSEYYFDIKFIGTKGIPPNLEDLKAAIEEIKPAHLGVTYTIVYTTNGELKTKYRHQDLKEFKHGEIKTK